MWMQIRLGSSMYCVLLMVFLVNSSKDSLAFADQTGPAAQCAAGNRLFNAGQTVKARPLLESGFAGRSHAAFATPNDLGLCALALGRLRASTDNLKGALTAYVVALRIFQQERDLSHEDVVLFSMGQINRALQQYASALEDFQQALILVRKLNEHRNEGATLSNIGLIYADQGKNVLALAALHKALAITRTLHDSADEGSTLNNIGAINETQGQYAQALTVYQQALALAHQVGDVAAAATAINNMALVYKEEGQYLQALPAFRLALAVARKLHDEIDEGIVLNNIGLIYRGQGQYAQALAVYQQALILARKRSDRDDEGVVINDRATVYMQQGQYGQALANYQQALSIFRGLNDHAHVATALGGISHVYAFQGQETKALAAITEALKLFIALDYRVYAGISLGSRGQIYVDQGKEGQALIDYHQALTILHAAGDQADEGGVWADIGRIYAEQRRYTQALAADQKALAIAHALGDPAGTGVALGLMCGLYENQGHFAHAVSLCRQALAVNHTLGQHTEESTNLNNIATLYDLQGQYHRALTYYQEAITALESVRATAGSEQARAEFISQYSSLYDRAVTLYHHEGQDDLAFLTSERGRARAFLDSLATGTIELSDESENALLAREQQTYVALQTDQEAFSRAQAVLPRDSTLVANSKRQLDTAINAHNRALAAIEHQNAQLAALVPSRTKAIIDRPAAQQLLDSQTTMIAYWVSAHQTLAFILTHRQFHIVTLPIGHNDLYQKIKVLENFADLSESCPLSAQQLYTSLITPLLPYLHTERLVIVPHDALHYLPFAGLCSGSHALINSYTLTTLPSVSSLGFIKKHSKRKLNAPLILGDPATHIRQLRPLLYADTEARAIAKLYGVQPLLGAEATAHTLRLRAPFARILHLAAHGLYNAANPLASAVYLAPSARDDGQLTVQSVYALNLHLTDLVVLSACETQLGARSAGDDIVGLTRAFMFAGTPSVVATLWSVDDRPTELLMTRFYRGLRAGLSKAAALQQAQLEVREQYPSPYFWAGFVLSGDGT